MHTGAVATCGCGASLFWSPPLLPVSTSFLLYILILILSYGSSAQLAFRWFLNGVLSFSCNCNVVTERGEHYCFLLRLDQNSLNLVKLLHGPS